MLHRLDAAPRALVARHVDVPGAPARQRGVGRFGGGLEKERKGTVSATLRLASGLLFPRDEDMTSSWSMSCPLRA